VIRVGAERHIVLIGLPGVGKTSVGRRLAKELGRPFADADEQLELTAGCTIPLLFRERGEAEFRRLEGQILAELLSRDYPLVVSAPGGAEIGDENRASLAELAVVLWLRGSVGFVADRSDPTHRPLLVDGHEEALARLEAELSALYEEVADLVVDIEPFHSLDGEPKRAIARHIVELLAVSDLRGSVRFPTDRPVPVDGREEALPQPEAELSGLFQEVADKVVQAAEG
jgi:shikimate kinase